MFNRYVDLLIGFQKSFVCLSLVLTITLFTGISSLERNSNYEAFFAPDNPQLVEFNKVNGRFGRSDKNIFLMLAPDNNTVFSRTTLDAVAELTERAWQLPRASHVASLTNYQHSYSIEDDIIIEDLYDPEYSDIASVESTALSEPLLINKLVSPEGDVTGINISFSLSNSHSDSEIISVVESTRVMLREFENKHPEIRISTSGMLMLNNAFFEATESDIRTLFPLIFILSACAIFFFLRCILLTASVVFVVLMTILSTMGVAGLLGYSLSGPTASAPTIVSTLTIAGCLHLLTAFQKLHASNKDINLAIKKTLRANLHPILLTSATTAIGFYSLNFSDVPPYQELGTLAAVGVLIAAFFTLCFLPSLVSMLPVSPRNTQFRNIENALYKFADLVIKHKSRVAGLGAMCVVICIFLLQKNTLNDNFIQYFSKDNSFRTSTEEITDRLTGIFFIDYPFDTGVVGGATDPEFLEKVETFSSWLGEQPEILHVQSIVDIIKKMNLNLNGDSPSYFKLPESQDEVSQYLLLYEMSLPSGQNVNSQINIDKSSIKLTATIETMATQDLLKFEQRVSDWLTRNFPEFEVTGVSPTLMFSHLSLTNAKGILMGALASLVLISFFLIIPLRSVRYGSISLLSNLLPVTIAFGIWGLTVGQISVGVSVVIAMTLGIVVDDTIHILMKYLRARREYGDSSEDAIRSTFRTVGVTLFGTTTILVMGFSVLAFSSFQINSHMGILSAITLVVALLVDLTIIPSMLMMLDGNTTAVASTQPNNPTTLVTRGKEEFTVIAEGTTEKRAANENFFITAKRYAIARYRRK